MKLQTRDLSRLFTLLQQARIRYSNAVQAHVRGDNPTLKRLATHANDDSILAGEIVDAMEEEWGAVPADPLGEYHDGRGDTLDEDPVCTLAVYLAGAIGVYVNETLLLALDRNLDVES